MFDEAGNFVMQIEPEPFRSRAQQQLKLILQFRNSEFPLANVPVRLFVLDDEMELQMRSWLKGFIVQSCASFSFWTQTYSICIRIFFTVKIYDL